MTVDEKVGIIIREKRKQKKMTLKELGFKVGVAESTIARYEYGQLGLSMSLFLKLCEVLELEPAEVQRQCTPLINNQKGSK